MPIYKSKVLSLLVGKFCTKSFVFEQVLSGFDTICIAFKFPYPARINRAHYLQALGNWLTCIWSIYIVLNWHSWLRINRAHHLTSQRGLANMQGLLCLNYPSLLSFESHLVVPVSSINKNSFWTET